MALMVTLFGALLLLATPILLDRAEGRVPAHWVARLGSFSLFAGASILHLSLALGAVPTVLRALDLHRFASVCDRLLLHLGVSVPPYLGWLSLVLFVVSATSLARGLVLAIRADRGVRAATFASASWRGHGFPISVVESTNATAFGLGGRHERIVISSGLVERLDPAELDVVIAHEAAHLLHRDPALLRALYALELGASAVPWLGRSVSSVRLAIERAADEAAVYGDPFRRQAAVGALMKATGIDGLTLPALSTVETLARRISALLQPQPSYEGFWAPTAALLVALPLAVSIVGVASWVTHGHVALLAAGWCPI